MANIPTVPNPWGSPQTTSKVSDAEFWLQSTATAVSSDGRPVDPFTAPPATITTATMNGTVQNPDPYSGAGAFPVQAQIHLAAQAPHLSHHLRSHSIDSAQPSAAQQWNMTQQQQQQQRAPTLSELAQQRGAVPQFLSQQTNGVAPDSPWQGEVPRPATNDPFDAAWLSRAPNRPATNPFQEPSSSQPDNTVTKAFTVNL